MGNLCGKSGAYTATPLEASGSTKAIIVSRAANLRHGDFLGGNDPYCVVRIGEAGSAWAEKSRGTGRRSAKSGEKTSPVWKLGFVEDFQGIAAPEVHVRVYDADLFSADDFLGEARFPLAGLSAQESEAALTGEGAKGSVFAFAGPPKLLQEKGIKPWTGYEGVAPMGKQKPWNVAEEAAIPMLVGGAPMPANLRGIFWLSDQKNRSALVSMGGPSRDGGGCSTGRFQGNRYSVRVNGDRVWSFADKNDGVLDFVQTIDLVYHFVYDCAENPKKCQIVPEARALNIAWRHEWLLDFEMELEEGGDEKYPGSVVWRRPSYVLGKMVYEYALVQVVDEQGSRIQPAWDEFVAYQKSAVAGGTPGVILYREIDLST